MKGLRARITPARWRKIHFRILGIGVCLVLLNLGMGGFVSGRYPHPGRHGAGHIGFHRRHSLFPLSRLRRAALAVLERPLPQLRTLYRLEA